MLYFEKSLTKCH